MALFASQAPVVQWLRQNLKNRRFIPSYIRGLFDADGSFYIRRKKDPVIEIISGNARFIIEISRLLKDLGFNPYNDHRRVVLCRKEEIDKFFKVIRPRNLKHINRYKIYKANRFTSQHKVRQWSNG